MKHNSASQLVPRGLVLLTTIWYLSVTLVIPADLQFGSVTNSNAWLNCTVNQTNPAGQRVPSGMLTPAGFSTKSQLRDALNQMAHANTVLIPDLATGTRRDFENYFAQTNCTEAQALSWHAAYLNPNFITLIKQLPGYPEKLARLKFEFADQSKFSEWRHCTFGSQPKGFVNCVKRLCAEQEREQAEQAQKAKSAAHQQAKQARAAAKQQVATQAVMRQRWPAQLALLQPEIGEWQELIALNNEYQLGDRQRWQQRMIVLDQLKNSTNTPEHFNTQNYSLAPTVTTVLQDAGLNPNDYRHCYGNNFQQLLHQENLDQLQQLGTLSPRSPIFYHKPGLTLCIESARAYNHAGEVYHSVQINDLCWAFLDYAKACCEGVVQGLILVGKDLIAHPEQALLLAVAGEYLIAYQLAKVGYNVVKIGITAWQDPARGQAEWDDYIAPVTDFAEALSNQEISLRDVIKTSATVVTATYAQVQLTRGMGKLCQIVKAQALTYQEQQAQAKPQLYLSTPEGKLLEATGEARKKLSRSERRILREQRAAAPITNFLIELPEDKFQQAIASATTEGKLKHIFGNPEHKLEPLVRELGKETEVVKAVLRACIGKVPANGVFINIPVNVEGYTVLVRGVVIDGIPMLGTFFIN